MDEAERLRSRNIAEQNAGKQEASDDGAGSSHFSPNVFVRNTAIWPRVTGLLGQYSNGLAEQPPVTLFGIEALDPVRELGRTGDVAEIPAQAAGA
jgi:hypothetical protein